MPTVLVVPVVDELTCCIGVRPMGGVTRDNSCIGYGPFSAVPARTKLRFLFALLAEC